MSRPDNDRETYWNGVRDGGLAVLAQALGVEPGHSRDTTLIGRRIKVTIEWPDGDPPEGHLRLAQEFAEKALERMAADGYVEH